VGPHAGSWLLCRDDAPTVDMSLMLLVDFERLKACGAAERAACLRELSAVFAERLRQAADFHAAVEQIVSHLRSAGHDLSSWDWDDDFEIWGPNYMSQDLLGLLLDFRRSGEVEISWCDHSDPTDVRQVFGDGHSG